MTTNHRPTLISKKGKSLKIQNTIKHARALPQQPGLKYRKNINGVPIETLNDAVSSLKSDNILIDQTSNNDSDEKEVDDVIAKFIKRKNKEKLDQNQTKKAILPSTLNTENEQKFAEDGSRDKDNDDNEDTYGYEIEKQNSKSKNETQRADSRMLLSSRLNGYESTSSEEEEECEEVEEGEEVEEKVLKDTISTNETVEANGEQKTTKEVETTTNIETKKTENNSSFEEESESDEEETAELIAELNRLKESKESNKNKIEETTVFPNSGFGFRPNEHLSLKKKSWRDSPIKTINGQQQQQPNFTNAKLNSSINQKFLSNKNDNADTHGHEIEKHNSKSNNETSRADSKMLLRNRLIGYESTSSEEEEEREEVVEGGEEGEEKVLKDTISTNETVEANGEQKTTKEEILETTTNIETKKTENNSSFEEESESDEEETAELIAELDRLKESKKSNKNKTEETTVFPNSGFGIRPNEHLSLKRKSWRDSPMKTINGQQQQQPNFTNAKLNSSINQKFLSNKNDNADTHGHEIEKHNSKSNNETPRADSKMLLSSRLIGYESTSSEEEEEREEVEEGGEEVEEGGEEVEEKVLKDTISTNETVEANGEQKTTKEEILETTTNIETKKTENNSSFEEESESDEEETAELIAELDRLKESKKSNKNKTEETTVFPNSGFGIRPNEHLSLKRKSWRDSPMKTINGQQQQQPNFTNAKLNSSINQKFLSKYVR